MMGDDEAMMSSDEVMMGGDFRIPSLLALSRFRVFVCSLVLLFLSVLALAQSRPSVTVRPVSDARQQVLLVIDGNVVEAESLHLVRGQQIMVWLRDLETLGWGKIEPGKPGETLFKGGGVTLSFTKNEGVAKVNSLAVQLPVDTYVRDSRLMVPMSFVAKALGYDCDVSYKAVATITTMPPRPAPGASNSIEGQVIYAGRGVDGVTVRVVDSGFSAVAGATARTDSDGRFTIRGLPDGEYMAYVYVADNLSYFNKASEAVTVSGGSTAELKPIAVRRVVAPLVPKLGAKLSRTDGKVAFQWSPCPGAASYRFSVRKQGSEDEVLSKILYTSTLSISANDLKPGVTYEAEVTAFGALGENLGGTPGVGGTPWSFSVR